MSTSLAEQLQRLALPQTSNLRREKKRASLLFDPKEAAGLRKETVFQIGLNGLEELIEKNPRFEEFSDTLFHFTAKDFERSVQSGQSNEKLDKHIRRFLLLLSPYFLFNCSYKALEWLIYRYKIHEYNRDDLIMLVLPYHESNIFVRSVQLLKLKDTNDPWYFLKTLQKSGVHLPKQSLINHATNEVSFLQFVSNFILEIIKVHDTSSVLTIAFNFYCSIFTGVIEYSTEVSEPQVIQMLPAILKGLSSIIPDYCAASYVIIAHLVAKTTLSDRILDKFVAKIASQKVASLRTEAVLVFLVLYQSQINYKNIPEEALSKIITKEWFPKVLQQLNSSGCLIYPFLEQLIKSNVSSGTTKDEEENRTFVSNLLAEIHLDNSYVPLVLNAILDTLSPKMKYSAEAKAWLTETIQTIEKQYPEQFDNEIYQILMTKSDNIKRRTCLQKIFKDTMNLRSKFDIFDKLYHPNSIMRSQAVKFLSQNYGSLKETEKEIMKSSFSDRLHDENIDVIKDALHVVKNVEILDHDSLKHIMIGFLKKYLEDSSTYQDIILDVIQIVNKLNTNNDFEILLHMLPLLMPTSHKELHLSKQMIRSGSSSLNTLLGASRSKLEEIDNCCDFVNCVVESLQSVQNIKNVHLIVEVLKKINHEECSPLYKYVSSLVLSNILPMASPMDIVGSILEILVKFFDTEQMKSKKRKDSIMGNVKIAKKRKLPIDSFLECFVNIILKTKPSSAELHTSDFSIINSETTFMLLISTVLISSDELYKKHFDIIGKYFFGSEKAKIEFILNLAISQNQILNSEFQRDALEVVVSYVQSDVEEFTAFQNIKNSLIPYVLILLHSPKQEVRILSLKILQLIVSKESKKNDPYSFLVKGILHQKQEIVLDHVQLSVVISNIFNRPASGKLADEMKSLLNSLVSIASDPKLPFYFSEGILSVLTEINNVIIFNQTSVLALEILNKNSNHLNNFQSLIIKNNIKRFDVEIAKAIDLDCNIWHFIILALKNDETEIQFDNKLISPSELVLNQLEAETMAGLEEKVEVILLDLIIEISTISTNPEILPVSNRVFKHIDLNSELVLPQLLKMKDVQSPKQDLQKRKRRISTVPTVDILDTMEWRKGVRVLEIMQDKKKIRNVGKVLPILFDILKKCLDFDEQAAVEYPKQLILSLILHCCSKLEDEKLPENIFNMELVVQCIRASLNPQTHYHALLVLAHTANLIPNQVLHHIMAIFTFMGSSVLRHDDAYSFQLITKIIDTIIPILVGDNNLDNVINVLRVFVDALLDVPEHRKMPLYKQLLTKVDSKEYLFIFLLLIFESHVLHNSREKQNVKNRHIDTAPKRLEIAANLTREFSPDIVIFTCIKLTDYLRSLPTDKEEMGKNFTIDLIHLTPKQYRHYKYTLVTFVTTLLSSKEFVNQIAVLPNEELLTLEQLYKDMIVNILSYIQRTSVVADKFSQTPQAQYWKVILHHSYDILDSLNALLTSEMFLLVVKGLLIHNLSMIRKRCLELLNSKLQYNPGFFANCERSELYALINPLVSIIESVNSPEIEPEQELIIQTALLSLKLLIKLLASEEPQKFINILDFITNIIKSGKAGNNVLASVILCLAELCVNLRAHAISSLPNFMPVFLKVLREQRHQESPSLLLLSLITAIQKILESLPLFISPYLRKLCFEISLLSSKWGDSEDPKLIPFVTKLSNIRQKIGSAISSRVLIPAIEESYFDLISKHNFAAVGALMSILGDNLSNLKGSEINTHLPELTKFFISALQFRDDGQCQLAQANLVENQIIQALATLILKLSETTFRPLYYKLYDWAVRNESINDRVITFYNMSQQIAQSLKSLFVLFAGHFVNNAAQMLDSCNKIKTETLVYSDEQKNILLLENVLNTLFYVFKYDSVKFLNKDRFEVFMQPIVDQLDNDLGGISRLIERNNKIITPCIVQFAVAAADDALWKQLNYQVLLKMRNASPEIRLISLKCLTEMVKELGEDFLPLLPETIPFLAELLEDEEETVEKGCKKAVQELEKILGEPLQKYF